jgi:MSHA biogenesis protein MshL
MIRTKTKLLRAGLLAVFAAACSTVEPAPHVLPAEDPDVLGEPVYEPMLVLALPPLQTPAARGRPVAAMTARNTPVADVLLAMFKDSDINLVVEESAQATPCTFDIKVATIEEAFESLLRSLDLAWEWDGSFLRIRSNVRATLYVDLLPTTSPAPAGAGSTPAASDLQETEFWSEVEDILPQLVGEGERVIVNQTASTIHVEASPATVERLRELVDTTVRRRNSQVSIEARILEVRLDDQHSLGVNWSLLPGMFETGNTGLGPGGAIVAQTAASGGTAFTFGLLDDGNYSVFVDALARQGQVRVLSSPRVSTMNNRPAAIRVADQIPVISREVITQEGIARTEYSVSFVNAGVSILVTPMIGEDGMISVRIRPEVTQQIGTVVTPDGLIEQPVLSERSTSTVLRAADGQAIVLGGLRSTRKGEVLQGVPFLMDLPLLGQLFSSTTQEREEVELMFVLVPRVLDADWVDEELRRGAHRLVTLRRPFRWNSIGLESFRPEDWVAGALQGQPTSAATPGLRVTAGAAPAPPAATGRQSITRAGLADQLLSRAQRALDDGQVREAIALLEQAVSLDPQRADVLVVAGVLHHRQGDRARARALLDRALAQAPADPLALTARGALELVDGAAHAARRWLEAAHAKAGAPWSACNLGAALLLCGDVDGARVLLLQAAAADSPPELFANLAYALLAGGDVTRAGEQLQRALAAGVDPRNPRIQALLRMIAAAARKQPAP